PELKQRVHERYACALRKRKKQISCDEQHGYEQNPLISQTGEAPRQRGETRRKLENLSRCRFTGRGGRFGAAERGKQVVGFSFETTRAPMNASGWTYYGCFMGCGVAAGWLA